MQAHTMNSSHNVLSIDEGRKETALSVSLSMTDEMRNQLRRNEGAVRTAESFVIDSQEMADIASSELKALSVADKKIEELYKGFVLPANQIIENARALFNPARRAIEAAKDIIKGKLLTYTSEREKVAAEARRKADEEARLLRQKADEDAAKERARAKAIAEQKLKEAMEAEAARRKAELEGNAKAMAKAAAESAKLQEQAQAAIDTGEAKANQAQLEAASAVPSVPVPTAQKVEGFSKRDNWTAEIEQGKTEREVILAIAAALPNRPELVAMLKLDASAASKMAKALKDAMNIPGMKAVNNPVAVSGR